MSNKTEIPVNLEVSGAEDLCQTEDGYVWIAQFSGLTRYDAKDFITYTDFDYDGQVYSVINVKSLASEGNTLYVATSDNVYIHRDDHFEPLVTGIGAISRITLNERKGLLYISTRDNGGIIYDIARGTRSVIPGTEGKNVENIIQDYDRDIYYYHMYEGVFDQNGETILENSRILEIYIQGSILYMAEDSGVIYRYDLETGKLLEALTVPDQVNRLLYSERDQILFVACEKNGIYCIDLSTDEPEITLAGKLNNGSQLVDLMVDYEGNLWVASHYIGASGVSIITRNALSET